MWSGSLQRPAISLASIPFLVPYDINNTLTTTFLWHVLLREQDTDSSSSRPYHIEATQRTATFLSPRDRSAKFRQLLMKEPRVGTDCIDIREYAVKYTKV